MNTIKVNGFVHMRPKEDWESQHAYSWMESEDMSNYGYTLICPYPLEFVLPDGFNPVLAEVALLEKQKAKIGQEYADKVRAINDRIANLQCIEYTPSTEDGGS